jgi:opacity protein-like surface antigen
MKKLLLSLFTLLLIGVTANQAHSQNNLGFGIRGGMNFANINDTDFDVNSRTGIMAGVYFNYALSNSPISIQPEVLYTQKGFETGDDTYRFDYIEIPVLARFNFINDSGLLPYVSFGPHIAFKVNADTPPVPTDVPNTPVQTSFNEGDINTTDFGVTVGAGLDFGRLDLGVRYTAGLTEVSDDESVSAKNGVFSIIAGIGF